MVDKLSKADGSTGMALKGKNDTDFGGRRDTEAGMMSCKTLDEDIGEQNARFVQLLRCYLCTYICKACPVFSLCGYDWNEAGMLGRLCPGSDRPSLTQPIIRVGGMGADVGWIPSE